MLIIQYFYKKEQKAHKSPLLKNILLSFLALEHKKQQILPNKKSIFLIFLKKD